MVYIYIYGYDMYVWFLVSFGNCLIVVRRSKSILAKPLLQNKFLLD